MATTLKDELLRHQLLLMRMIGTQAKATKRYLNKAKDIILEAIRTKNFNNLQEVLEVQLQLIPAQALVLVKELARYEAEYSYKKIKKNAPKAIKSEIKKLDNSRINEVVQSTLINTSIEAPKRTIIGSYQNFAVSKARQYMQIVADARTQYWNDDEFEDEIEERTDGLFTTQNLALAGLAVVGIANSIRNETASDNGLQVEWSLDLELNNCPYCEDMAAGSPYDPEEVQDEIPAHANCGCTLIPIFNDI